MLDYSILNNRVKHFVKDISTFNIRKAMEEIVEIQEDKVLMKNIQIDFKYDIEQNVIQTDKKRIQQVLLNIFSNAVKFTNRNGKIIISVNMEE